MWEKEKRKEKKLLLSLHNMTMIVDCREWERTSSSPAEQWRRQTSRKHPDHQWRNQEREWKENTERKKKWKCLQDTQNFNTLRLVLLLIAERKDSFLSFFGNFSSVCFLIPSTARYERTQKGLGRSFIADSSSSSCVYAVCCCSREIVCKHTSEHNNFLSHFFWLLNHEKLMK